MNNEIYGRLEVKIETDLGRKKKKNRRVETNYLPGIRDATFSLGRRK